MFKNILIELMEEKGINQRQLGIKADIPATTINGWMKGRLPDYNAIKKLSKFFNVTADYLLELENEYGSKIEVKSYNLKINKSYGKIENR